jgi:hypothetical protein
MYRHLLEYVTVIHLRVIDGKHTPKNTIGSLFYSVFRELFRALRYKYLRNVHVL